MKSIALFLLVGICLVQSASIKRKSQLFDISEYVAGGHEAAAGQFKYMAVLYISDLTGTYFCTGTIISKHYILTSAYCLDSIQRAQIEIGVHHLQSPGPDVQTFNVMSSNFKIHENWYYPRMLNDIALIKVDEEIKFSDTAQPIKLPKKSQKDSTFEGDEALLIGWGGTKDGAYLSNTLRWAQNTLMTNAACSARFPAGMITESSICLDGKNEVGGCEGDAGSALVHNNLGIQVGITSFGSNAGCTAGFPTVFTRVSKYLDWIEMNSDVQIED